MKRYDSLPNAGITECPEGRFVKFEVAKSLLNELRNIAHANPREWGEQSDDFLGWAKSRSRAAILKATEGEE